MVVVKPFASDGGLAVLHAFDRRAALAAVVFDHQSSRGQRPILSVYREQSGQFDRAALLSVVDGAGVAFAPAILAMGWRICAVAHFDHRLRPGAMEVESRINRIVRINRTIGSEC